MNIRSQGKLKIAVSCSSNMNRSMEAHLMLRYFRQNILYNLFSKRGFNVESFGSGNSVKLPGPSIDRPNVYSFDLTTYDEIHTDLHNKDMNLLVLFLIFINFLDTLKTGC